MSVHVGTRHSVQGALDASVSGSSDRTTSDIGVQTHMAIYRAEVYSTETERQKLLK